MSQITGLGAKRPWSASVPRQDATPAAGNERLRDATADDLYRGSDRQGHWISGPGHREVFIPTQLDPAQGKEARALIDELAIDGDLGDADAERLAAHLASHAAEINVGDLAAMMDDLAGMRAAGLISAEQLDRMHATVADAIGTGAPLQGLQLRVVHPHPNEAAVGGDVGAERRVLREVAGDGRLTAPELDRLWRVLDIEPHTQLGVSSMRPSKETILRLGDELSRMEQEGLIDAPRSRRMFDQIYQAAFLGYMPGVSGHGMLHLIGLEE